MRDYQIRGLNWMISLYENGINGILADEMVGTFSSLSPSIDPLSLGFGQNLTDSGFAWLPETVPSEHFSSPRHCSQIHSEQLDE